MRRRMRAMAAIAATIIGAGLAGTLAGPARAALIQPAAVTRPAATAYNAATTYTTAGALNGVAASTASNAWAVGYTGANGGSTGYILMLHWNGSAWTRLSTPHVLTGQGELTAITVVNAKDAWAVGSTGDYAHQHTLILHWNGTAWSALTSPVVANASLSAVWASTKQVWAAGYYTTGPAVIQTFPLSLDESGTRWTRYNSTGASGLTFDGVTTTTKGVALATGLFTGQITGFVARWNGHAWAWTSSFPEFGTYHWLNGIAAGADGTAFAAGINTSGSGGATSIEWNGRAWVKAPMPSWAGPYAIAFAPGGAGFSVGTVYSGGAYHELIMRWNGHQWGKVPSPSTAAQLNGLGFATAKSGWAVGQQNTAAGTTTTVIVHWNGSTWG